MIQVSVRRSTGRYRSAWLCAQSPFSLLTAELERLAAERPLSAEPSCCTASLVPLCLDVVPVVPSIVRAVLVSSERGARRTTTGTVR